jgi:hypothetical protein
LYLASLASRIKTGESWSEEFSECRGVLMLAVPPFHFEGVLAICIHSYPAVMWVKPRKMLRCTAGEFASSGSDRGCVFLHKRQALRSSQVDHRWDGFVGSLDLMGCSSSAARRIVGLRSSNASIYSISHIRHAGGLLMTDD